MIIRNEPDRAKALAMLMDMNLIAPRELIIRDWDPKRNNDQNALSHVWCGIMAKTLGYGKDEFWDLLKAKFIGIQQYEIMGIKFTRPLDSKTLNKTEFSEFMSKISALATELSIQLPVNEEAYNGMASA